MKDAEIIEIRDSLLPSQGERFDQLAFGRAVAEAAVEEAANTLNLSRGDVLLMAGEMSAQEWRTVAAVLNVLQSRMRHIKKGK